MTSTELKSAHPDAPLLCGGCGHNLYGASGRCPECGRAFDPNRLIGELIPWEQRKYAGYVRTYIRTAYLATIRPWEIARHAKHPVSYRSARLFRRITAVIGFVPLLIIGLILLPQMPRVQGDDWEQIFSPWSFGAAMLGLLGGLLAAASVTSWFFHRRTMPLQRRGRAVAVSCYACAPLAAVPLLTAIWAIAITLSSLAHAQPSAPVFVLWQIQSAPWLVPALSVFVWLPCVHSALVMMRVSTQCGVAKLIVAAVLLPVAWAITLTIVPAACVLLVAFVYLVARSFL